MLQGPFGPFYRHLFDELRNLGATVIKVNLNGSDLHGWGLSRPALWYRGTPNNWAQWLSDLLRREKISDVIMHSDCQKYHRAAAEIARDLGATIHVTEQGYIRPHWVTFEQGGVNANSSVYDSIDEVRRFPRSLASRRHQAEATGRPTQAYVLNTIWANINFLCTRPLFPGYRNAFSYPVLRQGIGHIRRAARNRLGRSNRRSLQAVNDMIEGGSTPFYLALLQCPGDSQIYRHSPFADLGEFCERVIRSFARNAPEDAVLVFKRHPLDHDLDDHRQRISKAAEEAGIENRLLYTDGGVLGKIIPNAEGVITINSTAGLTSVEMGCPTICLGKALYDAEGMTQQGDLDGFWRNPIKPNPELVERFMGYLVTKTQVNGDFATRRGIELALSGIVERLIHSCNTEQVLELASVKPFVEPVSAPTEEIGLVHALVAE